MADVQPIAPKNGYQSGQLLMILVSFVGAILLALRREIAQAGFVEVGKVWLRWKSLRHRLDCTGSYISLFSYEWKQPELFRKRVQSTPASWWLYSWTGAFWGRTHQRSDDILAGV